MTTGAKRACRVPQSFVQQSIQALEPIKLEMGFSLGPMSTGGFDDILRRDRTASITWPFELGPVQKCRWDEQEGPRRRTGPGPACALSGRHYCTPQKLMKKVFQTVIEIRPSNDRRASRLKKNV